MKKHTMDRACGTHRKAYMHTELREGNMQEVNWKILLIREDNNEMDIKRNRVRGGGLD
jgi:hypothetical protein